MNCKVCDNHFSKSKIPILLECGHSICSICVDSLYKKNSYKCPYDQKVLKILPINLKPNYELIEILPEETNKSISINWQLVIIFIMIILLLKFF